MKHLQTFAVALLLLLTAGFAQAQAPGNAVFSEVQLYDMNDGTALLEVRVSGSGAAAVTNAEFTATSPELPRGMFGGKLTPRPSTAGPGDPSVIFSGTFPLPPSSAAQREKVDLYLRADNVAPLYKTERVKRR